MGMNDHEYKLVKRCKKGDVRAFETLIGDHQRRAYNIALKMLKNPQDAMDVSQEAFIKVFKSIHRFNQKSSFATWMYRIVVNTCLDYLKKQNTKVVSLDQPIETESGQMKRQFTYDADGPETIVERKMTQESVHRAINQLDDIHKTVIILRDIQGFSYDEMAQILDCPLGTVKSRLKRARGHLKTIVLKDMEQNERKNV